MDEPSPRHLYMGGLTLGLPQAMLFIPDRPCAGCRICGAVFQSDLDRMQNPTKWDIHDAILLQKEWREKHNKTHTDKEHLMLALSGMWCTPEAAQKLASYGIISLSDMVLYDETEDALLKSSPMPTDDVEGERRNQKRNAFLRSDL